MKRPRTSPARMFARHIDHIPSLSPCPASQLPATSALPCLARQHDHNKPCLTTCLGRHVMGGGGCGLRPLLGRTTLWLFIPISSPQTFCPAASHPLFLAHALRHVPPSRCTRWINCTPNRAVPYHRSTLGIDGPSPRPPPPNTSPPRGGGSLAQTDAVGRKANFCTFSACPLFGLDSKNSNSVDAILVSLLVLYRPRGPAARPSSAEGSR